MQTGQQSVLAEAKTGLNEEAINTAVKTLFTTEFRNRLSGIISFNSLTYEMTVQIAKKELDELRRS